MQVFLVTLDEADLELLGTDEAQTQAEAEVALAMLAEVDMGCIADQILLPPPVEKPKRDGHPESP